MWILRVLCIVALQLVVAGRGTEAWACSCIESTDRQLFDEADVVFSGTATASDDAGGKSGIERVHWTFDVEQLYKGRASDPQPVTSARDGSSCGYVFEIGRRYQVFANSFEGRLHTSICTGTRLLGEPYVPSSPYTPAPTSPSPAAPATLKSSPPPTPAQTAPASPSMAGHTSRAPVEGASAGAAAAVAVAGVVIGSAAFIAWRRLARR